jgi:hypothetical protein
MSSAMGYGFQGQGQIFFFSMQLIQPFFDFIHPLRSVLFLLTGTQPQRGKPCSKNTHPGGSLV